MRSTSKMLLCVMPRGAAHTPSRSCDLDTINMPTVGELRLAAARAARDASMSPASSPPAARTTPAAKARRGSVASVGSAATTASKRTSPASATPKRRPSIGELRALEASAAKQAAVSSTKSVASSASTVTPVRDQYFAERESLAGSQAKKRRSSVASSGTVVIARGDDEWDDDEASEEEGIVTAPQPAVQYKSAPAAQLGSAKKARTPIVRKQMRIAAPVDTAPPRLVAEQAGGGAAGGKKKGGLFEAAMQYKSSEPQPQVYTQRAEKLKRKAEAKNHAVPDSPLRKGLLRMLRTVQLALAFTLAIMVLLILLERVGMAAVNYPSEAFDRLAGRPAYSAPAPVASLGQDSSRSLTLHGEDASAAATPAAAVSPLTPSLLSYLYYPAMSPLYAGLGLLSLFPGPHVVAATTRFVGLAEFSFVLGAIMAVLLD